MLTRFKIVLVLVAALSIQGRPITVTTSLFKPSLIGSNISVSSTIEQFGANVGVLFNLSKTVAISGNIRYNQCKYDLSAFYNIDSTTDIFNLPTVYTIKITPLIGLSIMHNGDKVLINNTFLIGVNSNFVNSKYFDMALGFSTSYKFEPMIKISDDKAIGLYLDYQYIRDNSSIFSNYQNIGTGISLYW